MTKIKCARGQALVEFALTSVVITVVVGATLFALYAHFARAWLEYTSEQALYCLSEGRGDQICRANLRRDALRIPFVTLTDARLVRRRDSCLITVRWRIRTYEFQLVKALNARRVLSRAGLRS